ncbi:hypothetical protein ACFFX0_08715 [Citricoccus parietis]|uniref:Uncharacterized protein n=1 Tax=Citricoccus parietis TaxID=592307 RepID=A0ABV5FX66_9MICC
MPHPKHVPPGPGQALFADGGDVSPSLTPWYPGANLCKVRDENVMSITEGNATAG